MVKEGKEQTDAYGYHATTAQYNVRTARLALLQCTSRLHTAHRVCHEFADAAWASIRGTYRDPILHFRIYTPLSGLVFGKEFAFGSNSSSARNSSSGGKSSSEFVFGKKIRFVFGISLRVGILLREGIRLRGIRLQEVIRLLGAIRLRGIRLRNSSSSAGGKVIPAQRPQCMHVM